MTSDKRWKLLSKEQIKMSQLSGGQEITQEEEIEGLKSLVKCMKHFKECADEELKEMYDEELKKIEEKYSTQK